jgi:CheY-like chemotaxis protein
MTTLRVLHVDDEPDIREVVEISLGLDPDFDTRTCGSGQEALRLVVEWPPDVILMDVMMPGMDGPAVLAHLRSDQQTARIPVVFMTARTQVREIDHFRSLGAAGIIPKPFNPMDLARSVRAHIPSADSRMSALRNDFLQRAGGDAVALAEHRASLGNGTIGRATLAGIRDVAHALAGAGGTYGCDEIGNAAAALEEAVIVELHGSGTLDEITVALDSLFACFETSGVKQPSAFTFAPLRLVAPSDRSIA